MGRRKQFSKLPKTVMLACPLCEGRQRLAVSIENSPQSFVCKLCEAEIKTPPSKCCVICAFSGKQCPRSIKMGAFSAGLELR